jgi:PilZ domain-containing protein
MCYAAAKEKRNSHLNSLDRRSGERVNMKAEILTFGTDTNFRKAHVIECSEDDARVVLAEEVRPGDIIGVVVILENQRIRTFARVAWVTSINKARTVAGLEFLNLDTNRAA